MTSPKAEAADSTPPQPGSSAASRRRLTRDRVLTAALALADEIGAADLTIRKLADALGTKPMSIYHHVDGKEAILDGIVDLVFAEIEHPDGDLDWKPAMRRRCLSARAALARHPWAVPLMDSRRSPGPATLTHHDAVVACLRRSLTTEMTAHAYATIDAYLYGFVLQEASIPATAGDAAQELAAELMPPEMAEHYPALYAFTVEHVMQPGYDFGDEFEFGLDLVLDGIERAAAQR